MNWLRLYKFCEQLFDGREPGEIDFPFRSPGIQLTTQTVHGLSTCLQCCASSWAYSCISAITARRGRRPHHAGLERRL
jgi:hypothetical protein